VFSYLRVDSHSTWEQRRNSPTECNRVQKSAMGKEAETDTESQAGVAVARSESVAVVAVHWRQLGGGFPPQTLNGEEGEDSYLIGRTLASFRAGGYGAIGSTEAFFACALAESGRSGVGVWAKSRGRAAVDSGPKPGDFRRGFGFEFGPWLAISTGRVRSRSPCGVRTRDEDTKRTRRCGWGVERRGREKD
jgi:hypothetical protein